MDNWQVGDKVCNQPHESRFSGTVIGHGWMRGFPVLLVQLDEGAYLQENECAKGFISVIVVHPDNAMRNIPSMSELLGE